MEKNTVSLVLDQDRAQEYQPDLDSPKQRVAFFKRRVALLGSGQLAYELFGVITGKRWTNLQVIGVVDQYPEHLTPSLHGVEILGSYENLCQVVEQHLVNTIVVCVEDRRSGFPVKALLDLKARGIEVIDGHQLFEEISGRLSIDQLRPSALIFSTGFKRRILATGLKRIIDVVASTMGLITLAPLLCLIAILIKLDSHGPVFYTQMRVGLRGKPFMIWKLRSMHTGAERNGPRWAQANDPRVSRVGRVLRKLRLDEVPQLFNVIRGDMSLVGPRPERPVFVNELRKVIPYYDIRHTVRPGLTGWAQTQFRYGANADDAHAKLQYDLYYVKNMRLALDLRILVKTVRVVLLGEGAQ